MRTQGWREEGIEDSRPVPGWAEEAWKPDHPSVSLKPCTEGQAPELGTQGRWSRKVCLAWTGPP